MLNMIGYNFEIETPFELISMFSKRARKEVEDFTFSKYGSIKSNRDAVKDVVDIRL